MGAVGGVEYCRVGRAGMSVAMRFMVPGAWVWFVATPAGACEAGAEDCPIIKTPRASIANSAVSAFIFFLPSHELQTMTQTDVWLVRLVGTSRSPDVNPLRKMPGGPTTMTPYSHGGTGYVAKWLRA